jgi:molybdate transport repressor ModE-like protein
MVAAFKSAGAGTVVFVVGEDEQRILEKELAHMGASFIRQEGMGGDMFCDVRAGLLYLSGICDRVLVTPAHLTLFSADTAKALLNCGHSLAAPVFKGKKGHPLMIGHEAFGDIIGYSGDHGLRGAIESCGYKLALVEVPDLGILPRPGQPGDAAARGAAPLHWRPVVRVQVARENIFLGPGCRQLLHLIDHTGSVNLACKQMGISYSKAFKIIRNLESEIGYVAVERKQGGKHGGESCLSPRGRELLNWFDRFEKECADAASELFARHYPLAPK